MSGYRNRFVSYSQTGAKYGFNSVRRLCSGLSPTSISHLAHRKLVPSSLVRQAAAEGRTICIRCGAEPRAEFANNEWVIECVNTACTVRPRLIISKPVTMEKALKKWKAVFGRRLKRKNPWKTSF